MSCHLYQTNACIVKKLLVNADDALVHDCQGMIEQCSFTLKSEPEICTTGTGVEPISEPQEVVNNDLSDRIPIISIHQLPVPYKVKADALFFPANIELNIDDRYLKIMSKGKVQTECNQLRRPIKMGSVYLTENGGAESLVKQKHIFHLVIAGESTLVNEKDVKSSTRKALMLAEEMKLETIVAIPVDYGILNIDIAALTQLSAIYTYFEQKTEPTTIKNIFIVMSDKESKDIYEEYLKRIFKSHGS